jgi:hypothetical protein
MEHPRWGSIMCVESIRPIKAGEELFTHYGYGKGIAPDDFLWYHEAQEKLEEEERQQEERETEDKKRKKKKKSRKLSAKKK